MMSLREAAAAMAGTLQGEDRPLSGVSTDTRTLAPGELFVAIKGERFDASRFVAEAFAAGAAGAVVPADALPHCEGQQPLVVVDDSRLALGRLAAWWRRRFDLPLIAVTGSNGKTTVKDMIALVLRNACGHADAVLATEGNLNNDIGMPLTLLKLRAGHRYAAIEMGMNHAGEIRYLSGLARPHVALVTNAGSAHIGLLGSLEAIARAKGEVYEGLDDEGIALVNADDAFAPLWRQQNASRRVIDFGLDAPATVSGRYTGRALDSDIVIATPHGRCEFRLDVPGEHNVRNAVAAAAAAFAVGVPESAVATSLGAFRGPKGRLQRREGANGATVIDDTYNANPDSTRAAIAVLASIRGKRVLVLGDMGELGEASPRAHAEAGAEARAAGLEQLLTLGEASAAAAAAFGPGGHHFDHIEDLIAALRPELGPGTTVLVKGSRFMRMERVVEAIGTQAP